MNAPVIQKYDKLWRGSLGHLIKLKSPISWEWLKLWLKYENYGYIRFLMSFYTYTYNEPMYQNEIINKYKPNWHIEQ